MEIKILGRYRDRAGAACRAALATVGSARARGAYCGSTESAQPMNIEPSGYFSRPRELQPDDLRNWGFRAWYVTVDIEWIKSNSWTLGTPRHAGQTRGSAGNLPSDFYR